LSEGNVQVQEELMRTQASFAGTQKELAQARNDLAKMPTLEKQVQYLEADLKLAREKVESLSVESLEQQQELARCKATCEALRVEKEATTKRLENQLSLVDEEMEALRIRDKDRAQVDDELASLRLESSILRKEKDHIAVERDSESQRWMQELEALRNAKDTQYELQEELTQRALELEVMKHGHRQQQTIEKVIVAKTAEAEVRSQVEDTALKETLSKLKSAAPQRLKDLRDECDDLRKKNEERLQVKEQLAKACAELDMWRAKYGGDHEKFLVTV
jgi:chromosome segregation ATPase